jgi:hypothetical protein
MPGGTMPDLAAFSQEADDGSAVSRPVPWTEDETMSKRAKYAVGGVAVGIVLLWVLPVWVALLIIVGVPVGAYLTLDKSQRTRLRGLSRKGIGR